MLVLFSLLIFSQTVFAADNETIMELVSEDTNISSNEYYFDCEIDYDSGDGSQYNPYNELTTDKIKDNSIIHLQEGTYYVSDSKSLSNVTLIGSNTLKTVIDDFDITVKSSVYLINLTFTSSKFTNNGVLTAENVIFKDTASSVGGVIQAYASSTTNLNNCTFSNNYASDYAGVIYTTNSTLTVTNSLFSGNYASNYAGAIYSEAYSNIVINNTQFIGNYATSEVSGAIYIKKSDLTANNITIADSSALFGGAIVSLQSNVILNKFKATNNIAKYNGGAILAMYGKLNIYDSVFNNNTAENGGALFIDNVYDFNVFNTQFINNNADNTAGAVYMVIDEEYRPDSLYDNSFNNVFTNNNAAIENDVYELDFSKIFIGDGNYILIKSNDTTQELPSSYDLRTLGQVTSVKSQGSGGNCWAFSSLGALESCILKATGLNLDLSEENMKNLMSLYSTYGWSMEANKGGYDDMGIGYLTSWLGPVNESDDVYSYSSEFSPVLNSIIHVQNILFLTRTSYTDNDAIKTAIMKYGGVSTSVKFGGSSAYMKDGYNYYYNGNASADHAVVIIGWDDNYSKDNFKYTPPGDGAWIIKNSWGSGFNTGDKGYYYVSYYDTRLAPINKTKAIYTFVFNDTIKYDKNYQYDIPGKSDYFFNTTSTVWYKNIFKATDNEFLTAVSTYFEKQTTWDLSVYVNNVLKLTQSGKSQASYSTIELNEFIPLKINDTFEVIFKITVDGDAGVPISEFISFNHMFYSENMSFISYDGKKWVDFYDLSGSYTGHSYLSQVACIKAFTILNPVNTTIDFNISQKGSYVNITATVYNQYGFLVDHGTVTFTIDGKNYDVDVIGGIAKYLNAPFVKGINEYYAQFKRTGFNSTLQTLYYGVPALDTSITLTYSDLGVNPVEIKAVILDENNSPVKSGEVIFNVEGKNYTVSVNNGTAVLNHQFEKAGITTVTAYYDDEFCYNYSNISKTININLTTTKVNIEFNGNYNPLIITATVLDSNGNTVTSGNVTFVVENEEYERVLENGKASFEYIYSTIGWKSITVKYNDLHRYASSQNTKSVTLHYVPTYITINVRDNHNPSVITAYVKDYKGENVSEGTVKFTMDGDSYDVELNDGVAQINHTFSNDGVNSIYASYSGSQIYSSVSNTTSANISKIMLNISININQHLNNLTVYVNTSIPIDDHFELYCNGSHYITKSENGIVVFKISNLDIGTYNVSSKIKSYIYDSENVTATVYIDNFKSEILSDDSTIYFDEKITYQSKLVNSYSEAIVNEEVQLNINGEVYNATTDEKGIVEFNFNLNPGIYNAVISFEGNHFYLPSNNTSKITVKTTINDKSQVYTYNSNYIATLTDSNGKALANKEATISVNGKTYSVYTDANGKLSYNLKLTPATYSISVSNLVTGEVLTKKVKIVKRINSNKDMTVYYGDGKSYTVRVLDDYGNPLKNVKVTFKINSKTYTRTTNSNGYASLKIALNPNKYTITATYKGFTVKNKITVKSTIITKNLSVKKGKTFKFTAKLLNSKGKILKNKKITIKFKGVTYKVKTNSKGIATLKISKISKVGKYTIKTIYGKLTIQNKITVKK